MPRAHRGAGGPRGRWGLPYWNYTDFDGDAAAPGPAAAAARRDPAGRRDVPGVEARPDGLVPQPAVQSRSALRGRPRTPPTGWADASDALLRPHFANQEDTGRVSFGGGVIEDAATTRRCSTTRPDEIGQLDAAARLGARPGQRRHGAVRDRRPRPGLLDAPLQRRPALGDLRPRPGARLPVRERGRAPGRPAEHVLERPGVPVPARRRHHRRVDRRPTCSTSPSSATPTTPRRRRRCRRRRRRTPGVRDRPVRPRRRGARAGRRGRAGVALAGTMEVVLVRRGRGRPG